VVICSDGLDRGDPAVLAAAMERLSRLSHRLVWLNPHQREESGFRPSALGLMVAAPHIDLMLPGHDLASLERLAALLPAVLGTGGLAAGGHAELPGGAAWMPAAAMASMIGIQEGADHGRGL
jgi:hypothetical protein